MGLANNTMAHTDGPDELQCVQHDVSEGDLGWAVGSPVGYAKAEASRTASSRTGAATPTSASVGKKNGGVRDGVGVDVCVAAWVVTFGLLL